MDDSTIAPAGLAEPPPRILLVEFSVPGRFVMGPEFPYIKAYLSHRLALKSRWIRFGLPAAATQLGSEEGVDLAAGDGRELREIIAAFAPTHILFSHPPSAALIQAVETGPAQLVALDPRPVQPESRPRQGRVRAFPDHVGALAAMAVSDAIPAGQSLFSLQVPDFSFEAANTAARQARPLGFIMAGAECAHRTPIADNPHYSGVDLEGCIQTGCAFCLSGSRPAAWPGSILTRALEHIQAFHRTHPPFAEDERPGLRLIGHRLPSRADALAQALVDLPLAPSDLLFDGRADHILAAESSLTRAAEILARTKHRLAISLIGIENFSQLELDRMNKGLQAWQSLAAIRLVRDLERRFPDSFSFSAHGGLSTILYTPWTRVADLALNLAVVRHFSLKELCGKLFSSRLRLVPGLAMEALAQKDGLLVKRYDDPALDTARRNFYPREQPWRFAEPALEPLNRLMARFDPADELESDPLYERVQGWLEPPAGPRRDELAAAEQIVSRALDEDRPLSVDTLLEAVAPSPDDIPPNRGPSQAQAMDDAGRFVRLHRAGLARVTRLESLAPVEVEAIAEEVREAGLVTLAAAPGDARAPGQRLDLYIGAEEGELRETMELTRLVEASSDPEDLARARARIGALLGYPACCAERFAAEPSRSVGIHEWLLLLRRVRHADPVDPLLSPFFSIPYVPCAFDCPDSLALARARMEVLESGQRHALQERAAHPVLFLLDRPGQWAEIIPHGPVDRSFRFDLGVVAGRDPRLRDLAGGGELTIEPGLIRCRKREGGWITFPLTAALFSHQDCFDRSFWEQCAVQALDPISSPGQEPNPREEPIEARSSQPGEQPTSPFQKRLLRLFSEAAGTEADSTRPWTVQSSEPDAAGGLAVTIGAAAGHQGSPLRIHIAPAGRQDEAYYLALEHLVLRYDEGTPLDTPQRRSLMRRVAAWLKRQTSQW